MRISSKQSPVHTTEEASFDLGKPESERTPKCSHNEISMCAEIQEILIVFDQHWPVAVCRELAGETPYDNRLLIKMRMCEWSFIQQLGT